MALTANQIAKVESACDSLNRSVQINQEILEIVKNKSDTSAAAQVAEHNNSSGAHEGTLLPLTGGKLTGTLRTAHLLTQPRLFLYNQNRTKGTAPSESVSSDIIFADSACKEGEIPSGSACSLGSVGNSLYSDGRSRTYMQAVQNVEGSIEYAGIHVEITAAGVGSAYASVPMTINGICTATSHATSSDRHLKDNLEEVDIDLSSVKPYRYTLKGDGSTHVGLIAQDVQAVIPEAISTMQDGFLALDYSAVVAALVGEVNKLKAEVEALKRQINA